MQSNGFRDVSPITDTCKVDDKILHVYTKHAFIQSIGYLKYKLASEHGLYMAMRGQRKLYGTLTPSLFHNIKNKSAMICKKNELTQLLLDAKNEYRHYLSKGPKKGYPSTLYKYLSIKPSGFEPLLQHYGIPTTWLDLVDNIWVALWFACHKAQLFCGGFCNYSMYEKRNVFADNIEETKRYDDSKKSILRDINNTEQKIDEIKSKNLSSRVKDSQLKKYNDRLATLKNNLSHLSVQSSYAYVILVGIPVRAKRSMVNNKKETLLDLRSYFPSLFLRPHAQHGLLFRKADSLLDTDWDYSNYIEGIIRIDLTNALEWLGNSETLSASMLFPSPVKDVGLQKILRINTLRSKIEIVTA